MNENIITIYDKEGNKQEYKILLIIEKEYYYIIYTDINSQSIKNNLNVIKVSSLDNLAAIPINDDEWNMLENEYNNIINQKTI